MLVVSFSMRTFLAVSSISVGDVLFTLVGFVVFYSTLAIIDVYLMAKTIRIGPDPYAASSEKSPPRQDSLSLVPAE